MNWEAIGAIGEIIGAAAVVATLGYLAIQTRQSNKLARSNTVLQLQAENRTHRNILAQDEALAKIVMRAINGEALSELELFRYQARSDSSMSFFESIYIQFQAGIITKEDFEKYGPAILRVALVARDHGIERNVTLSEFQKYIDNSVREHDKQRLDAKSDA
jgi:hypothetical protein